MHVCICAICFFFFFIIISWNFNFAHCVCCFSVWYVAYAKKKALRITFIAYTFVILLFFSLTRTNWQLSFQLWTIWFVTVVFVDDKDEENERWRKKINEKQHKQMLKKKCYLQLNWQTTATVKLLHTNLPICSYIYFSSIHSFNIWWLCRIRSCTFMRTNFRIVFNRGNLSSQQTCPDIFFWGVTVKSFWMNKITYHFYMFYCKSPECGFNVTQNMYTSKFAIS